MAKLMVIGKVAQVEIIHAGEPGGDEELVTAKCYGHGIVDGMAATGPCPWSETYDDLNDATEYASDHADGVR